MAKTAIASSPFSIQDMVKAAMNESVENIKISQEAREQLAGAPAPAQPAVKTASKTTDDYSTERITKLASALDFMASECRKEAAAEPGSGPGALTVTEAKGGPPISHMNRGQGHHVQPVHPGTQKGLPSEQGETLLANTLHHPPGTGKQASAPIDKIRKVASAFNSGDKATIHAPAATPHSGLDSTQSIGGMPGNSSHIASNKAVIDTTKGQAKAPVKGQLKEQFNEPALSGSTDPVLAGAFEHSGQAGTKLSSVPGGLTGAVKVASARNFLQRVHAAGQK